MIKLILLNQKLKTILIVILGLISTQLFSRSPCKLILRENSLIGKCEHKLFTNLEIILDKKYTEIDSSTLFKMLPRNGLLTIQNTTNLDVQFVITYRAGFPQIMFKPRTSPRVGWYTFDNLNFKDNSISFDIDLDPDVPVLEEDLKILGQVRKLLPDSLHWNRNDDRKCQDDNENGKYSFFCALQTASTITVGEYNHRNAVMQIMRQLIEKRYPEKKWVHRFKDFNNMPQTTFNDIITIIDEAEKIIRKDLKDKE